MDKRLEQISDLLTNYSMGNFDKKVELSKKLDEIDTFIAGVNMLGEELKSTTISKNYFNNIFHAVSDLLIVLNMDGTVKMINKSASLLLNTSEDELIDLPVSRIMYSLSPQAIREMLWHASDANDTIVVRTNLLYKNKKRIDAECSINLIHNDQNQRIGYLLIARDLNKIKEHKKQLKKAEDRYKKIFDETSDAVFICDSKLQVLEMNRAGTDLLDFNSRQLHALFVDENELSAFHTQFNKYKSSKNFSAKLKGRDNKLLHCLISINKIDNEVNGFQGIIKDVSNQKELENILIKTILDTQEKERKRLAKDLHDSLGQQLSALMFYVNTLRDNEEISVNKMSEILSKSYEAISNAATELRNVCFNLMPRTLENYGLAQAVRELCSKTGLNGLLSFELHFSDDFPEYSKPIEVMLFRVIQEFINNSIKHAQADVIKITFETKGHESFLTLEDNGVGFDLQEVKNTKGMGIDNIKSRLAIYNTQVNIYSAKQKGTCFKIKIPNSPENLKHHEQQ
jgi:PAS domain S-box-containing protein